MQTDRLAGMIMGEIEENNEGAAQKLATKLKVIAQSEQIRKPAIFT